MPSARSSPALACIVAMLLIATAPLWHHHRGHHDQQGHEHHEDQAACEVCHAVLQSGPRDLPAATPLILEQPLRATLTLTADADPVTRFVRRACARGPPRVEAV